MIGFRCLLRGLLILPASTAYAQSQPDNAALLKAIQQLGKRLDRADQRGERMQKEIDQLKAASGAPAAAPAAAAGGPALVPAGSVRKDVTVKGWKIDVVPADNDTKDPVANFNWDAPDLTFGQQAGLVSGHNVYVYKGLGVFYPDEEARYVFQLTLKPLRTQSGYFFSCAGTLKINDELLAEGRVEARNASGEFNRAGEVFQAESFSGGSLLKPVTDPKKGYALTFQVACYSDERDRAHVPDFLYKQWQDTGFSIQVKGPDDAKPRAFAGNELYHAGRVKTPAR